MRSVALFLLFLFLGACGGGGSSPTGPSAPPPAPASSPTPTPSGPIVVRRATLTGANGHAAGGTADIVRNGSAFTLELRDDFRIDTGSIDVYLANQGDRVTGTDLNLGDLRSRTGAQTYTLPDDGAGFRYVLLWCRPFRVPIGIGELR